MKSQTYLKNSGNFIVILAILSMFLLLASCSKIVAPSAIVHLPNDSSIGVIGFAKNSCSNCVEGFHTLKYDIVKIEDKGSNIGKVGESIQLKVTGNQLDKIRSFSPHRTVLIAEKKGKYYTFIHIAKN